MFFFDQKITIYQKIKPVNKLLFDISILVDGPKIITADFFVILCRLKKT